MKKYLFLLCVLLLSHKVYPTDNQAVVDCTVTEKMDHCIQTLMGWESSGKYTYEKGDSQEEKYTKRSVTVGESWCAYIGNPIVMKLKCGTYCYARIKCGVRYVRDTDTKFEAGSFCQIKKGGTQCPDPGQCYGQPKDQIPNIASVTRVKDHTGIINRESKAREKIEKKELELDDEDNQAMAHSTAPELMKLIAKRESVSEGMHQGHQERDEAVSSTTRGGSKRSRRTGGLFGGIGNFFRCLFKRDPCHRRAKSTPSSDGDSKAKKYYDDEGDHPG